MMLDDPFMLGVAAMSLVLTGLMPMTTGCGGDACCPAGDTSTFVP
jgi:hypothetical protein